MPARSSCDIALLGQGVDQAGLGQQRDVGRRATGDLRLQHRPGVGAAGLVGDAGAGQRVELVQDRLEVGLFRAGPLGQDGQVLTLQRG